MKKSKSFRTLLTLVLMAGVLVGYSFISAQTWTDAPTVPPGSNTSAPVNISSAYQAKAGDFGAVQMRAGRYCNAAGDVCLNFWGSAAQFLLGFTDGDEIDSGIEVNNNYLSFVADRNNNGGFDDFQGRWPLSLYMNNDLNQEFARFSNQVRATQYCNSDGTRCVAADQLPFYQSGDSENWIRTASGSGHVKTLTIAFPVAYVGRPVVTFSPTTQSKSSPSCEYTLQTVTTGFSLQYNDEGCPQGDTHVYWQAIGI